MMYWARDCRVEPSWIRVPDSTEKPEWCQPSMGAVARDSGHTIRSTRQAERSDAGGHVGVQKVPVHEKGDDPPAPEFPESFKTAI